MKFFAKSCEQEMHCVSAEMAAGLQRLAEPVRAGESVKALINKASRRSGMSFSRVRELWYGRGKVTAQELEHVRRLLRANTKENINAEIAELRERLARLEEYASGFSSRMGNGASR